MNTPEIANVGLTEEVLFFQPFMDSIEQILCHVEDQRGNPIPENIGCFYIPKSAGKQRPLREFYLIASEWLPMRDYLMGKGALYYFYEPQMRGLVNKDATLWIFPDPNVIQQFCFRENIKLNQFSPKAIRKVPPVDISDFFMTAILNLLNARDKIYSMRAQECERSLKLVPAYLPKAQANHISYMSRLLLKIGFHEEIEDLVRILKHKVLVEMPVLKKRTRAAHTLSMKYYFFNASDREKSKIDALVSPDAGSQLKALEYIERRIMLSFNIWKPPTKS